MKFLWLTAFLGLLGIMPGLAQIEIPPNPAATPKKFATRSVGGGVNPGVTIEPGKKAAPMVRYVTHIILYGNRLWTSSEGKPLDAKLIAFEDLTAEAAQGSGEPTMPDPPPNPTVIREGKIRLLVGQKPVEVALERLAQADREFVDQIRAALAKKAAAAR